jgi:tetratricopeptide (TPR) repeat protein
MTAITNETSLDDLRQQGNFNFSKGNYDDALTLYSLAIERCTTDNCNDVLQLNLCNRSACYYQMEEFKLAQQDAEKAWLLSKKENLKAAYRLAKANVALKEYDAAKETIQRALELDSKTENKPFQELWKQVLNAAYDKPQAPETSIKFVKRPISIREFTKSQELGTGNFSEIVVATHKETNERFALKIIEKKQLEELAKRQHPNVYNEVQMERRVLLERQPPNKFIILMYHAFQDYNSLYYLMDLHIERSDLWREIRYKEVMVGCHRSQTKIWLYELVDALEHMHKNGIVHRDLKPENILINKRGHM